MAKRESETVTELNLDPLSGETGAHPMGTGVGAATGGVAGAAVGGAGRHRGRRWEEVKSELERGWERAKGSSRLAWSEARQAARDAWRRVEEKLPGDADRDGR
jgi:hypothetical protein